METIKQTECKFNNLDAWIIGGCTALGLGTGFFLFQSSATAIVGCIMIGIGVGLVISSLIAKKKNVKPD